jgi:predicted transcriptional regulator
MTQPVVNAVMDSINYCNRTDTRYEDNEHYFDMSGRAFKLKVLDIRRYRNPVHSFFKIRYKMCTSNMNLDEANVIAQLRLEPEEYYRLLHPTP